MSLRVVLIALALLLAATPTAMAESACDRNPADCDVVEKAFLSGMADLVKNFFWSVGKFFGSIWLGFIDNVVTPLLQLPGNLLSGLGEGAKELGREALGGAGGSLKTGWQEFNNALANRLGWAAFLAPLIAGAIVGLFLVGAFYFLLFMLRRTDDVLPGAAERNNRDDSKR